MNNKQIKIEDLQKKVKTYYAEETKLLKKLGIVRRRGITFPKRQRVPWLSKIASRIISMQGGVVDDQFTIFINRK